MTQTQGPLKAGEGKSPLNMRGGEAVSSGAAVVGAGDCAEAAAANTRQQRLEIRLARIKGTSVRGRGMSAQGDGRCRRVLWDRIGAFRAQPWTGLDANLSRDCHETGATARPANPAPNKGTT
jgi:hypothetical protein